MTMYIIPFTPNNSSFKVAGFQAAFKAGSPKPFV